MSQLLYILYQSKEAMQDVFTFDWFLRADMIITYFSSEIKIT